MVVLGAGPNFSVGQVVRQAQRTFIAEGDALVAGWAGARIVSQSDGTVVLEGGQVLRVAVRSVARDGAPCLAGALRRAAQGEVLTTQRACEVVETWTNGREGLEHALVLGRAPAGHGPLRVRLDVEGPWHHADAQGHVFAGPGAAAQVRYGNAFVVRGGARLPISVAHVEGGLELVVPEALVDAPGAFPLHLDPLVTAGPFPLDETSPREAVMSDESEAAVAWLPTVDLGLVVWVDSRRGRPELFGTRMFPDGGLADTANLLVLEGRGGQRHPALVANPAGRFTLAWEQHMSDGGTHVASCELDDQARRMNPVTDLGAGSAPSLAADPEQGLVLLGWAQEGAGPRVTQVSPGAARHHYVGVLPNAATVTRTSLSARGGNLLFGVEATAAATGLSHVYGFVPPQTAPLVQTDTGSNALLAQRLPAVLLSATGLESWMAWEQDVMSVTSVFSRQVVGSTSAAVPVSRSGRSPALTLSPGGPVLGFLDKGALAMPDSLHLEVPPPQAPYVFDVPTTARELALTNSGASGFLAAYTVGRLQLDVEVLRLGAGGSVGTPQVLSRQNIATGPGLQRDAHVAFGSTGFAVWRQGLGDVRGTRLSRNAQGLVQVTGPAVTLRVGGLLSRVEMVDVALGTGDVAFIAWRERGLTGASIQGVLRQADGSMSAPLVLSAQSASLLEGTGPVVAWDGARFVVAWTQPGYVAAQPVALDGTLGMVAGWAQAGASDLAIECEAGACALAWALPGQSIGGAFLGDSATSVEVGASQPALSHDGTRFVAAFFRDGGYETVALEAGMRVPGPRVDATGAPRGLKMARGNPPVLTWVDDETSLLWLARPGVEARATVAGDRPDLAVLGTGVDVVGVVVADHFSAVTGGVQPFALPFSWVLTVDAGGDAGTVEVDAGTDAGRSDVDAGVDAGGADGGLAPQQFVAEGCACSSTSVGWALGAVVVLMSRRSRRVRHDASRP